MRLRAILALVLVMPLFAAACGVKSDLLLPNGKETPKGQKDPSKPPTPNGQ